MSGNDSQLRIAANDARKPSTIGTHVSSGCIRLINEDVSDLYSRVNVGTKVIVLPMDRRAESPVTLGLVKIAHLESVNRSRTD